MSHPTPHPPGPLTTDATAQARILAALLAGHRFRYHNEIALQDAIEALLAERDVAAGREVVLGPGERIDFLTPVGLGVEVKVDGQAAAVRRQLARYATHDRVDALLLVTTRARHAAGSPATVGGKPLLVAVLRGGF